MIKHTVSRAAWDWVPLYFPFMCYEEAAKCEQYCIMGHDFSACVTLPSLSSRGNSRLSCQERRRRVCVRACVPACTSLVSFLGLQIAFVWSISLAIYSLSGNAATDEAEVRHCFIRPPLHFTPIPFAPYYSHLTVRECARLCTLFVYAMLSCFAFGAGERARRDRTRVKKKKKKR